MEVYSSNTRDTNLLLPKHRHTLEVESPIDSSVTRERGTYSARTGKEVPQEHGWLPRKPGMVMPVHPLDGGEPFARLRLDEPGDGPKYMQPKGMGNRLDVHPSQHKRIKQPGEMRYVIEGAKKVDSGVSIDILAAGVSGVFNGQKDGELIEDWDLLPLDGEKYSICFDSDITTNYLVQMAADRMARLLQARGAEVYITWIPPGPDNEKQGLDDFLANGGTKRELEILTRPYDPADFARIHMSRDDKLRAAVEDLRRRWWDYDWVRFYGTAERPHIMRGHSCKGVVKALINRIARHGRVVGDEVHVSVSQYTLAEEAATRQATVSSSVKHLEAEEWLEFRPSEDEEKPGTYVFRASPYQVGRKSTTERNEVSTENLCIGDTDFRAPALRWSAPTFERDGDQVVRGYIRRLGKINEGIIHRLEREGEMHINEVAEALRRRARDLTRNSGGRKGNIVQLEEAGVVEVEDDRVRLTEDWEDALQRERELKGEIDAAERQRNDHKRKREAFRNRHKVKPDPHWSNTGADGRVEDLRLAGEPEPEPDNRAVPFVLDYVGRLGKIRFGLLVECWQEYGDGDIGMLKEAVKLSGVRLVRQPENGNALFLYPPLEKTG